MNKEVMFSSKNHEWETPDDLFKMLDMEFNFQVDLACEVAWPKLEHNKHLYTNTKVKDKCLTSRSVIDGKRGSLNIDWCKIKKNEKRIDGYMWLNPPYGKTLKDWVKK